MKKTLKKSVSILLTFIMVFSVFSVVPFTVSAAGSVLTLSDSNASGTGWTWNASTKTLTMSGATFDDCVWLKVDSATIVLTDGTNNVMHGGMYNTTSTGRKCWSCICVGTIMPTASGQFFETEGTLTIKGSGKLTMSPTTTTHYFDTFAINCYKLIFGTGSDNPVLDYTAQKSYFHSYALQMNSGFTLNSGDIKLSCGEFARNKQDWFAVGVLVRNGGANAIVINDGSLEIDVSEGALTFNSNNDVISTCKGLNTLNSGAITINGGNIDINVAGNANTQRCIDASGKVTINAGTLKLKNTKNNQAAYAGGNLAIGEFTTYTDCSQSGKYIYLTSTDTQGTIVTKKPCTVTWKNGDEVLKTEALAEGSTPSYDGTTPEKAEDENYTYTFSGWNNGETTYAPDQLPAVSGNVTYTAQYTATAKTFKVYAKKLTGETYTIENLTGETTVAQLKEIIADQIDIPATAQRLIFAGKQLEDAKTLAEYNIGKESTIHLVIRGYTVTWLNYDNSELGTTTVQYGATPSYDGETPPERLEDAQNTYTFTGWKNGETTYAPDALPAVTGDVTYTATFTKASNHIHDGITFEPWTSTNSMPSTAGNYYLTQDLTIHSEWRAPEGTTRICLNGHKITTYEHFLMVSGTELEIYDEEGGGSMDAVYRVGSMFWVKGGKFVLNGGTINGNVSTAGIVDVAANATFTMNGGTLTGRAVNRYDACGIRFTGSGGTFNMNGGEITGLSTVAGVTYFEKSDVTVNISGNSKIYGNTLRNGTTRNLYLSGNAAVNVGELGSDATIGVTMQTPGVFTNSTDISNNDASKFFSDKSDYIVGKNADGQLVLGVPRTVTWKNDDGSTIDTTTVADGGVPTHDAPEKAGYDFAGWKNGETTYAPGEALPAVTGDVTYTATFKAPKKLISGCSLTLDGDIIINFNIDPSAAGLTPENIGSGKELTVTFEWAKDFSNASDKPKTDISKYSKTITVDSSNVGSKIPVSCPVCAAEMSCQVRATATLNGKTETKDYSVRDYADSVLAPREGSNFEKMKNENPTQYNKLADLVTTMVDYGAKAQQVFNINIDDPANKNLAEQNGYEMDEEVTDEMFVTAVKSANKGAEASDMKKVAEKLGANYYTSSLIFLDRSTLRHYFTKKDSTFNPSLFGNNHQNNTYYYVEETNIPAHELDKLQEFKIGNTTFYYSALDYARGLNASSAATPDMKDLAKSLYWYSDAANAYAG